MRLIFPLNGTVVCKQAHLFAVWREYLGGGAAICEPTSEAGVRGGGGGGGGRGTQQSFIRGVSAPRSKPLPFYVPFLIEKVPLLHTSHRKLYPFHIPSWGFKIFCLFQIPKWQFSLLFPILELVKSLPFHIPPAQKRYPFRRAEPPSIVRYREYPPPPPHPGSRREECFFPPQSPRRLRWLANRGFAAKILTQNPKQVSLLIG